MRQDLLNSLTNEADARKLSLTRAEQRNSRLISDVMHLNSGFRRYHFWSIIVFTLTATVCLAITIVNLANQVKNDMVQAVGIIISVALILTYAIISLMYAYSHRSRNPFNWDEYMFPYDPTNTRD